MKKSMAAFGLVAALAAGACSSSAQRSPALEIPAGTDISVEKTDGTRVAGRLVEARADEVVLETAPGQTARVPRAGIARISAVPVGAAASGGVPAASPSSPPAPPSGITSAGASPGTKRSARRTAPEAPTVLAPPAVTYREITIPSGTVIPIELETTVGSESSSVEDRVRGTVRRAVVVNGVEAIPAGAVVHGTVIEAARPGRVKGRARVAFRFTSIDLPGDAERVSIRTETIAREAEATKKQDAAKIGGAAAAGAVIGGIVGGGDGAAKGAAIGGGAGTGVVLSTRGKDITVPAGTSLSTRLSAPLTLRVKG